MANSGDEGSTEASEALVRTILRETARGVETPAVRKVLMKGIGTRRPKPA